MTSINIIIAIVSVSSNRDQTYSTRDIIFYHLYIYYQQKNTENLMQIV